MIHIDDRIEATQDVVCATLWLSCRDAAQIPWGEAGADVICESTGVYTTVDKVHST